MAELADALDSGSSVRKGRGGSNPLLGTLILKDLRLCRESFFHFPPPHQPQQHFTPADVQSSPTRDLAVSASKNGIPENSLLFLERALISVVSTRPERKIPKLILALIIEPPVYLTDRSGF